MRVMELHKAGTTIRIVFEQKYGVWFWTKHEKHPDLANLDKWGCGTERAIRRMADHCGYEVTWIEEPSLSDLQSCSMS
jgi:hypothetical protein